MKLLSLSRSIGDQIRESYAANPRRLRAIFLAALAVVVVVMSVKYAVKISKPGDSGLQSRSAFLRWRHMINGVFAGENIYVGVNEYPNPPIMAILLKPFAALPPVAGALAWFYAKVLMAVLAAAWVFRLASDRVAARETRRQGEADTVPPVPHTPPPSRRAATFATDAAKAAAVVLCLPPLLGDLSHNNVNIFILFLVVGCLEAFRRRLDTLAGLILALSIACKVTPLLFLAYFGWKRCWRVVLATLAGLALWLAVVPGVAFGWGRSAELMDGWHSLMIERPLLKGEVTSEHPNQAVVGFVYRLFTHSPSYVEYPDNIPTPAEYHNLADIGRPAAWVVVKALTAAFAFAVVLLCRWPVHRVSDSRQGWRLAAECGLICLGMLLLSERTWKHHAVVLLVPLAGLTFAVATGGLPRRVRNFVIVSLAASFVLMVGPGLFGGKGSDLGMVYGTHTLGFLLLTVAVGLILSCRSGRAGGSCEPVAEGIPE